MARRHRILIDLNVILDVLLRRESFYQPSAAVLAAADQHKIEAYAAARSLTTLFYLISRSNSAAAARTHLVDLLQFLSVAGVDETAIRQALALPYADFEDAVQMAAAVQVDVDYVVTRNIRDFKTGPLPAISPVELLALL